MMLLTHVIVTYTQTSVRHTWSRRIHQRQTTEQPVTAFLSMPDIQYVLGASSDYHLKSGQNEPPYDNNKMSCAPSEDSDQPGHPSDQSLRYPHEERWGPELPTAQRRLWSDWADAYADLSLRWAHMPFCWFCHEAAQTTMVWEQSQLSPRRLLLRAR